MRNNLKQYNQSNPFVVIINNVRSELQSKIVQFTRMGVLGGGITIAVDLILLILILVGHQESRYATLLGYATIWTLFSIVFPLEVLTRIIHSKEMEETEESLEQASTSDVLIMNNEKLYDLTRRLERLIGRLEFARTFYLLNATVFGIISVVVIFVFL